VQGTAGEQVLSALIHELSTPITAIEGFVSVLAAPLADLDEETYRRSVDAIQRNVAHLRDLLATFADARRVEVDAFDLRRQPTDIGALVEDTAESLRTLVAPHPLSVTVATTAAAEVDAVRVRQAVINLVQNAAKFSPQDGAIDITVSATATAVKVVVADEGRGVPSEARERVFERFVRLHRDAPGSGLGLYISRGIARAHGGDIVIESSSAAGSRFALMLPIGSAP
jgi:signal transduction histidine kinase